MAAHILAANRAACHLKLENFGAAIVDATEAIKRVSCFAAPSPRTFVADSVPLRLTGSRVPERLLPAGLCAHRA